MTLRFNQQDELSWMPCIAPAPGAAALYPSAERAGARMTADYQTIFATQRRRGRRAHRRTAFHPGVAGGFGGARDPPGHRDASCRRRDFLPVRSDDVTQHRMHAERGEISAAAAPPSTTTRAARRAGRRCRHHQSAPAGKRRHRGRHDRAIRRRDIAVHSAGLPVPRRSIC